MWTCSLRDLLNGQLRADYLSSIRNRFRSVVSQHTQEFQPLIVCSEAHAQRACWVSGDLPDQQSGREDTSIAGAGSAFNLGTGMDTLILQFSGLTLRQSRVNGPYDGTVNLMDATGHTLQSLAFVTKDYAWDSFSAEQP